MRLGAALADWSAAAGVAWSETLPGRLSAQGNPAGLSFRRLIAGFRPTMEFERSGQDAIPTR